MSNFPITPQSVDSLVAELSAFLAVEDAHGDYRGPVARARTSGTSRTLSVQTARGSVFLFGTFGCYEFAPDALALISTSFDRDGIGGDVWDQDGDRMIRLERDGDALQFWGDRFYLSLPWGDFLRALARAEVIDSPGVAR